MWKILTCAVSLGVLGVPACGVKSRPPSAVIIVIDTLRADHLGSFGYDSPTSPNLDGLQGGSWILFQNAYAHSPWTLPSFGSILTSMPPPVHRAGERLVVNDAGKKVFYRLQEEVRTIAEILGEDHGFRTAAFVNNPYLSPRFGLDRGFERYDHAAKSHWDTRPAEQMVDLATDWLSGLQEDERFLVLLHFLDPHIYYDPPDRFASKFVGSARATERPDPEIYLDSLLEGFVPSDDDKTFLQGLYDGEIAYVDEQIGRFLDFLDERDLLDSTAIVITADHGEEFWDHGSFEHGHSLYDELVHVPLWVKLPAGSRFDSSRPASGVTDRLTCHVDIVPTLLDLLELETSTPMMGRSHFSSAEPTTRSCYLGFTLYGSLEHQGIVQDGFKLIEDRPEQVAELYDLSADPGERTNLIEANGEQADRLRYDLDALNREFDAVRAPMKNEAPLMLDREILERLEALGYIR
jgi:arylsulfatase